MTGRRSGGRPLVPAYLSTGGVARPTLTDLERLSLLTGGDGPVPTGLPAARHALLDVLDGGTLTLVETAALLELPVSAVRVLAAELVAQGLVRVRAPVPPAALPAHDLLKRVADGLRALKQ